MDKKIKLIAVILGAFSLLAAIIAFSYFARYNSLVRDFQQLQKEKHALRADNESLAGKVAKAEQEAGRMQELQNNLKKELERFASERQELQNKYTALQEQRDKLIERLKQAGGQAAAATGPSTQELAELQNKYNALLEERDKLTEGLQQATGQAATTTITPGVLAGDEYWAGVLKEKGNLELQISGLKDILKNNQLKIDELTRGKLSIELEIQKLTKEKTDIQRQLEYSDRLSNSMSLQLVREKEDKRKIQKQTGLLKEENSAFRNRLKDMMNTNASLEEKLKETENKRMELYNRLNQMDQLLQDKLSEVLETRQDLGEIKKGLTPSSKTTVELSPIVVSSHRPEGSGLASDSQSHQPEGSGLASDSQSQGEGLSAGMNIAGKIVSVNEEKGFVIIDSGQTKGIYPGQALGVYRDAQQIASLEVIQVRPNASAADIKEKTGPIKVGDVVK